MEQANETITLDYEEINELAFRIKVEGVESPAKVRLVCENNDVSYMFNGRGTHEDGVVQFIVPLMKGKIQEGTYPARIEVLIDNRYFSPVQFNMHFKKTMQVFAEAVNMVSRTTKPEIRVSAVPVVVSTVRSETKQVAEQKQAQPAIVAPRIVNETPKKAAGTTLKEKFSNLTNSSLQDIKDEELREFAQKLLIAAKKKK